MQIKAPILFVIGGSEIQQESCSMVELTFKLQM